MTNDTQARGHGRLRRAAAATLAIAGIALLAGAAMTWAWNTLAVDLADAPRVQFKHALAFEAALAAIAWLTAASARLALRRHEGRERPAAR
ncbi:MAG TPA: hypothetical protein VIF14_01125 [Alphaproteobacteria bacterium]|jgi:hypothetical protein